MHFPLDKWPFLCGVLCMCCNIKSTIEEVPSYYVTRYKVKQPKKKVLLVQMIINNILMMKKRKHLMGNNKKWNKK